MNAGDLMVARMAELRKELNVAEIQYTLEISAGETRFAQAVVTESVNNGELGAKLTGELDDGVLYLDLMPMLGNETLDVVENFVMSCVLEHMYRKRYEA